MGKMNMAVASLHATRRHRRNCRATLSFISACFVGSGIGTLLGQAPEWPDHRVWAIGGFAAAIAIIGHLSVPCLSTLQAMTAVVVAAAALRGLGYLFAASSPGLQWAGAAAWFAVAAYALRTHRDERRHFL